MNILVIGTGVIGTAYGWQLSKVGFQITHLIRNNKTQKNIEINCLDMRNDSKEIIELYNPNIITSLSKENVNNYQLIIVPVKVFQLKEILQTLKDAEYKNTVFILQNVWITQINTITDMFSELKIVYGQPHILGGGVTEAGIRITIFSNKNAPTMMGTKDGKANDNVVQIKKIIEKAQLNPKIDTNIIPWLLTHYVESAGLLAGVMKAKNGANYVATYEYIKDSVRITREGYKVCRYYGVHTLSVYPQCLYYAPMFLISHALRKMFSSQASQLMIQGHISHSPDEMKYMFNDVLETGLKLQYPMKTFRSIKPYVDDFKI